MEQQNFNHLHAKERVIIERCFGQIKQRFPVLANCVQASVEKVQNFVACTVLHNVAKQLTGRFHFENNTVGEEDGENGGT